MPTVKSVSTEPFRSSIGKIPMTSDVTTRSPTVVIRLRNSRRMSCIPLRIRWPSSTAGASDGERVVRQDDVRDAASRLAAALHRDPEVRLLQREDVVHAVADHRHVVAA